MRPMPACDARYDVILSDGIATWKSTGDPRTRAVLDFLEDRVPDDFGEPGPLLAAVLERYWSSNGKAIRYGPVGIHNRMMLWADNKPCRADAKHRRYLRWRWVDYDPPIDPEYEDPA